MYFKNVCHVLPVATKDVIQLFWENTELFFPISFHERLKLWIITFTVIKLMRIINMLQAHQAVKNKNTVVAFSEGT